MKLNALFASVLPGENLRQDAMPALPEAPPIFRVEARSVDGGIGLGESLLQGELSGETARSALDFVERLQNQWLRSVSDVESLQSWIDANVQAIDWNPAAWMAVELALLDLLAKDAHISLEKLLGLHPPTLPYRCTAVIGEVTPEQFDGQLTYFICGGYRDYKIALSGNLTVDRTRVEALEAGCIPAQQVRAGARRLWMTASQAIHHLSQLQYPFWALEEPLAPGALSDMRHVGEIMNARIVLDESVRRIAELEALAQDPQRWVLSITLSKAGGLLRALSLTARARRLGLWLILTAPAAERPSGLRALLSLGAQVRDRVLSHEGGIGAPNAFSPREVSAHAEANSRDIASHWLQRPGLGVDPVQ